MIEQIINNYKIVKEIDTGGMGTVYLGKHLTLDKEVAIKKLHPHLIKNENIRSRFLQEAETQSLLKHEGITDIIDYVDNEQGLFIILEYLEGYPLNKYIFEKKGLIPEGEANELMIKILDAVQYAHEYNVVHRDLKPSNIMVLPNGEIKILDFGIAKIIGNDKSLTQTGTKLGSPLYMSPEQVLGKKVDHRSDIYSLGVLYYEMLTGNPVYNQQNTTQYQIYDKIVKEPLPRVKEIYPHTSEVAQEIIDKATSKDIDQRFNSCATFQQALRHGKVYEKVIEKKTKRSRSNNRKLSIGLLSLSLLLLLGFVLYRQNNLKNYKQFCNLGFSNVEEGLYNDALENYETASNYLETDSIINKVSALRKLISGLNNFYEAEYSNAFYELERSAALGNKEAYYYLGELAYNGLGTKKNYEDGWQYTNESYKRGFGMAAWRIGSAYEDGIGVDKDEKKANEFYEIAYNAMLILSKNKDPEALGNLGSMFSSGNFVDRNSEKAFEYHLKAAQTGYAFIQSILASCYFNGYGVEKNVIEGMKWLEKSAEQGHPTALLTLGNRYLDGDGVNKNESKGISLIKEAANKNYPDAFSKLGYLYYTGEVVPRDYNQSFLYTKKAVEFDADNLVAMENLAFDYAEGVGIDTNYVEAVKYYKNAFEKNNYRSDNLVRIANLYLEGGYGLEKSESEFIEYCTKAENLGNDDAKAAMGMYYNRKGVEEFKQSNYSSAIRYFKLALKKGNEIAEKNLSYATAFNKIYN